MKNIFYLFLLLFFFSPAIVRAETLGQKLSGKILLNVEKNGEAWYVYPENKQRYFLGRPADAFKIMRELGLGIMEKDFQLIAQAGMSVSGNINLAKKLSGKIILQVEKKGEAWYVNPDDFKKYYLGRPADAFRIMRELSLGISQENLAKIHKPGSTESIDRFSSYEHKSVYLDDRKFSLDIVEIDLKNPKLKIITDAHPLAPIVGDDKDGNYGAGSLGEYVLENLAFAGINGTYFCDSSGCAKNYYFYPVYDSKDNKLINNDQLKYWTTGPIVVFDSRNKFYYFKDSREFKGVQDFVTNYHTDIRAAIGNRPRLIENKMNALVDWDIDAKQRNVRAVRNALAFICDQDCSEEIKGVSGKVYFVVLQSATLNELAEVLKVLNMDYALNLDGGYSAALWYNDEYMVGPGRNIPNAILFSEI
jgi:hypothetical protein